MNQPSAPPSLPKYMAEGLPKQDDETLRDIQKFIDELLEARRKEITTEELPDTAEPVDDGNSGKGTLVKEKVKCGDKTCHCADGDLHGPYLYRYFREGDTVKSEYEGKP